MSDSITILSTVGPKLTKVFKGDGSVESYDDAASFKTRQVTVTGIDGLAKLLDTLAGKPKSCIIRGAPLADPPVKGSVEGTIARQKVNFTDQPLHMCLIDVDGYRPDFGDPVLDAELVIAEYIERCLPPEFFGASCYWQLSSSAGTSKAGGKFKAHLWFWLADPRTTAEMAAWAKTLVGQPFDRALFRLVQIHYTAAPIFEDGATDPVPVRSGLIRGGFTDEVYLQIDAGTLAMARESGSGQSDGSDMKLVDPSQKPGLIGAFHRTYTPEQVLGEMLEGFEQVTDRRWTWHGGGGTPEGVWVHQDEMHVGSSHNTWPIDGIANLWDVVRVFKFGDFDRAPEGADDFERLNAETAPVGTRPSDLAMLAWAASLPELVEAVKEERATEMDHWRGMITTCEDVNLLETVIAREISATDDLSMVEREQLVAAFQTRIKDLTNVKLSIGQVRKLLAPARNRTTSDDAPEWAKYWVWVAEQDGFMNTETKQVISERSYNAKFDRHMGAFSDEEGRVPRASELALTAWDTKAVDRAIYLPNSDLFFSMDGAKYINLYRPDLSPPVPDRFTADDREAIRVVEEHATILIPDDRERRLFLDYLAYCVQRPGSKIRWAILLKGIPGDGKTAFATLLGHVMGHPNVRTLSSSTLEGSDFSGWSVGQCVVAVEEVKLHGHNRHDVYNKLKPFISNDTVEVHPKGRDPYNVPNTSNYVLLTNFDDALPVDDNDRRIFFLRSLFATKEHLFKAIKEKTGLDHGDYFDRLFDQAIKKHTGALRKWLVERELSPEFRADGRAPVTAARDLAVDLSMGEDELAVIEQLRIGGTGVYPNIVSVSHLVEGVRRRYDGMEVRTRRVATILANQGFSPFKRLQWRGSDCRVYFRDGYIGMALTPDFVRAELERLEKAREEAEIDGDFGD